MEDVMDNEEELGLYEQISLKTQKKFVQGLDVIAKMMEKQHTDLDNIKQLFLTSMKETNTSLLRLTALLSVSGETTGESDNKEIVAAINRMAEQTSSGLEAIRQCMQMEEKQEEKGEWAFTIIRNGNNLISSVKAKRK